MSVKVFILDDHDVVRAGVAAMIDATDDLEVVGQARSVNEAADVIAGCDPEVAVLDVRLPDGSGIDVCRQIRDQYPEVSCLVLTSFEEDQALVEAVEAGAAGFVLKDVRGAAIVDAIRKVSSGHRLIDNRAVSAAKGRMRDTGEQRIAELTPQERRIFDLIGEGYSNREIASEMYLAEKTVKNYVSKLLMKLGKVRRTEAAALAARLAERGGR